MAEDHSASESNWVDVKNNDSDDSYLRLFDILEQRDSELKTILHTLADSKNQDERIFALIKYVIESKKFNSVLIELLINMNNHFGSPS